MFINTEIYNRPLEDFSTQYATAVSNIGFSHPLIAKVMLLNKLSPLSRKEIQLLNHHLGYIIKASIGH